MADTVQDVFNEARGLLNDVSAVFYTDASLLPLINKAYRELQREYNLHGLSTTKEVSSIVPYTAGQTTITLPADLLRPIEVAERNFGSTDTFTMMDEKSWEPDEKPGNSLQVWTWREEAINVLGALQNRDVRIRYVKSLSVLAGVGSVIAISGALTALAARTAALAARHIGENPTRGDELDNDAGMALDKTIVTAIRQNQSMPTRRKRTRYRRP